MATYKDIHGTTVRNSAGNLTGAATGELFYDSTNSDFKYRYPNVSSSWRSSNDVNTARRTGAGLGTQTAALISGGYAPGAVTANTEIYDGTSWTETGNLNTARRVYACGGTTTAAIVGGGFTDARVAVAELWDGSSWTEVADLSTARNDSAVGGVFTSTATL